MLLACHLQYVKTRFARDILKKMPRRLGQKKRVRQRTTNWVFTLNNYTTEETERIQMLAEPELLGHPTNVAFVAFSFERGGKNNIPHLQGFLQLYKKGTFLWSEVAV